MKRPLHKALILVFAVSSICAAGCQEAEAPSEKKSRVIAARNMELEKQVADRDKQIDDLKAQHTAKLGAEQKKLGDCQKQTADCKQRLEKGMEEKVNEVLVASIEESAKIRAENEVLKAEIAELKAKLNPPAETEKPNEPEKKE